MQEREQPKKMVRTEEVLRKAEDLSQINDVLHRIQGTANQPKPGNGGTPPGSQTGNKQ